MAMSANLLVRLENLSTSLKTICCVVSLIFCSFLLILFCPLILKITRYFLPLFFSTAICSTIVYLLISSERQAAREVLLVKGKKDGHEVVQIYDDANSSIYTDNIEVGCFLLMPKSEMPEAEWPDGEEVLVGKLEASNVNGVFAEAVASFAIDSMAEGMWNYYFGRCSKWS